MMNFFNALPFNHYKRVLVILLTILLTGAQQLGYIDAEMYSNIMVLISLFGGAAVTHAMMKEPVSEKNGVAGE